MVGEEGVKSVAFYKKKIFLIPSVLIVFFVLVFAVYFFFQEECSSDGDCSRGYTCAEGDCINEQEESTGTEGETVASTEDTGVRECDYDSDCEDDECTAIVETGEECIDGIDNEVRIEISDIYFRLTNNHFFR